MFSDIRIHFTACRIDSHLAFFLVQDHDLPGCTVNPDSLAILQACGRLVDAHHGRDAIFSRL
jgi:hypothetical protein